jgi:hypothetical protein
VPAPEKSAQFDAVNRHLQLGGELYGYADVDGDLDSLADKGQSLLKQFSASLPQLAAASKWNLKPYLKLLGFEDLKAMGFSSVAVGPGEYVNRGFLYLPSGRRGVFAALGGRPHAPRYLALAPADADVFEELDFDVPALASAIKQAWIQAAGPEAEGKFERGLIQGGKGAGISVPDMIRHLRGEMVIVVTVDPSKTITLPGIHPIVLPYFQVLIGVEGIGPDLQPVLDRSPVLDHRDDNGRRFYRPKMGMMIPGFNPAFAIVGTTFFFSSNEYFLRQGLDRPAAEGLAQNPDFVRLQRELGADENTVAYGTPRLFDQIKRIAALNPDLDANVLRGFNAAIAALPPVTHPFMQVIRNTDDGILYESREFRSLKPILATMALYPALMGGMMAARQAAAHPAPSLNPPPPMGQMPGASALTPDQRVERNLRILSALARIYYRRTGKTTATYDDLIGPGKPISTDLPAVEGEDYRTIKFQKGRPVQVTLPDGRTLTAPVYQRRRPLAPSTAPAGP